MAENKRTFRCHVFEASKYGICLFHLPAQGFKEHFHWTFKSCVVLFHTLFPHCYKRTMPVVSGTFRDISLPSFAFAPTFLWLIFFRLSSHAAFLHFCYIVRRFWFTFVLWSVTFVLWSVLWGEGRTPFDCHFRRIDAVAVSHHLIKDVEIGEAFFNLLNSSFSGWMSSLL